MANGSLVLSIRQRDGFEGVAGQTVLLLLITVLPYATELLLDSIVRLFPAFGDELTDHGIRGTSSAIPADPAANNFSAFRLEKRRLLALKAMFI